MRRVLRQVMTGLVSIVDLSWTRCGNNGSGKKQKRLPASCRVAPLLSCSRTASPDLLSAHRVITALLIQHQIQHYRLLQEAGSF